MRSAFNLGIGLIAIVRPNAVEKVLTALESELPVVIGTVVTA
jgi:phosphoribosylaminoimidazole (AIR) synthetase